jgi:hypothetical protein
MKKTFKVGDKVKVLKKSKYGGTDLTGNIFTVTEVISEEYGGKLCLNTEGFKGVIIDYAFAFDDVELTDVKNKSRSISYTQAQEIIKIACARWKVKLAEKWAKEIVLERPIEITEEFYQKMRKACTGPQNASFDEIFGKDTNEIDLSKDKVDNLELFKKDGDTCTSLISVRSESNLRDKSFYLNNLYDWKLVEDVSGVVCLVPTRKK